MISVDVSGDFRNTERFTSRVAKLDIMPSVRALAAATPVESGETAAAWGYEIRASRGSANITWINSHQNAGVNIAIILQIGHGTGTGGWVSGRNYINPAIQPVMDQIAEDAWKVVTTA